MEKLTKFLMMPPCSARVETRRRKQSGVCMTQNCFRSIRMVVSGPRRSENQRSSRAGVLGRDSCQTVHLPKPDVRFVFRQMSDISFIYDYNNRYIALCQVILRDVSLFFCCVRYDCMV